MDKLQVFQNSDFGEIRIIEKNGRVLFCGSDVAKALGYAIPRKAVREHCKNDGGLNQTVTDSLGRKQQVKFVTESDVYRLIVHSKLPSAEKFEKWVFDEVLPTIRATGRYETHQEEQYKPTRLITTDDYIEAGRILSKCTDKRLNLVIDLLKKAGIDIDETRYKKINTPPNTLDAYLNENIEITSFRSDRIRKPELEATYIQWCVRKQCPSVNKREIAKYLKTRGVDCVKSSGYYYYCGIAYVLN